MILAKLQAGDNQNSVSGYQNNNPKSPKSQQADFTEFRQGGNKFKPTKQNNPCPVCGDTSGKCRTTGTNLVLCASTAPLSPGWKSTGFASNDFWQKVYPDNGAQWTEQQREQWSRDKADREQQRELERLQKLTQLPSLTERHNQLSNKPHSLTQGQIADLLRRGLTQTEIDSCLAQGWLWQESGGYGIGAIDPVTGLIVGGQKANDDRKPKYSWLLSGQTNLAETGQNPLSVWVHPNFDPSQPFKINFAEGFLKPLVSGLKSWRVDTQQIWIGAAGGIFQDKALARVLSAFPSPELFMLWPDAGSISNPNVIRQYGNLANQIESLNVAWWGQTAKTSPDCDELTGVETIERLTWTQFSELFGQNPVSIKFLENLSATLKWLSKKGSKGFQKNAPEIESSDQEPFRYSPGNLPKPKAGQISPKVVYDRKDLAELIFEAKSKNWLDLLDTTPTGLGKSTEYARLDFGKTGFDKVWLFSKNHRNPTTIEAEERFTDFPTRNSGFYSDSSRLTPLGKPRLTIPKGDQEASDLGNCIDAELFHLAASKGIRGSESSEGGHNPICKACPHFEYCGKESDFGGYGFRFKRKKHLEEVRLTRSHLSSAPENNGFDQAIAILDEDQIETLKTITPSAADIAIGWDNFEFENPEFYEIFRPLKQALKAILNQESGYHGLNHEKIIQALPKASDLADLGVIDEAIKSTKKSLDTLLQDYQSKEIKSFLENASIQWLSDFLAVWAGMTQGALRVTPFGQLQISIYDGRQNEILEKFGIRIQLDATGDLFVYSLKRQIQPENILVVEMAHESLDNLEVIQIMGLGLLGKNRSADSDRRVSALLEKIKPDVTFDWLAKKEDSGAIGHWFSDHVRGSNDYSGAATVVAIGLPTVNFGAVEDEWLALGGHEGGLSLADYYRNKIDAEIIQAIGRNRSNRYPGKKFIFYFLGDSDNCQNLNYELPAKFSPKQIPASQICLEAGSRWEIFVSKVEKAIDQLRQEGLKVTKTAVAKLCNVSQQYVSKVWEKVQPVLLNLSNSTGCENFEAVEAASIGAISDFVEGKISSLELVKTLYSFLKNFNVPPEGLEEFFAEVEIFYSDGSFENFKL